MRTADRKQRAPSRSQTWPSGSQNFPIGIAAVVALPHAVLQPASAASRAAWLLAWQYGLVRRKAFTCTAFESTTRTPLYGLLWPNGLFWCVKPARFGTFLFT